MINSDPVSGPPVTIRRLAETPDRVRRRPLKWRMEP
jgi:hypothetical protein